MKNKILKIYIGSLFTFVFLFSAIVNGEWQDIYYAIHDNDVETVKGLISLSNDNLMARDKNGATALMLAADLCKAEIATELISKMSKPQLNARDDDGNTALMFATNKPCYIVGKKLIDSGANVNARNGKDGGRSAYDEVIRMRSWYENVSMDEMDEQDKREKIRKYEEFANLLEQAGASTDTYVEKEGITYSYLAENFNVAYNNVVESFGNEEEALKQKSNKSKTEVLEQKSNKSRTSE